MKILKKENSFSQKKIRQYDIRIYSFAFILLVISVSLLFYSTHYLLKGLQWFNPLALAILILMGLGMVAYIVINWTLKSINIFFDNALKEQGKAIAGDIGEGMVLRKLQEMLDDSYTVHLNYKILNKDKFDIDLLVVGPKGLIAIEVKNYSDRMLFFENQVIKVRGSGYTRQVTKLDGNRDPRNKFKSYCKSLNHHLYSLGINNVRVKRVMVFINEGNKLEENPGTFIVLGINKLGSYFAGLRPDPRFTADFCEIVNKKLGNRKD